MDDALARDIARFLSRRGMECPTFISPIFDRVMAAVPLVVNERTIDFRDLLAKQGITLVLDYKPNARFSALPPTRTVFLGVDGLERSWAYSYLFVGAGALFLADSPYAISAPAPDVLDDQMHRALLWAIENDVDRTGSVYPIDLPKPRANPYADGTQLEKLHFNSFITAVAWITLHEIAHIVLNHSTTPTDDLEKLRRDEREADAWAAEWLMEKAPTDHDRVSRLNGIVLGIALAAYLEMWTDKTGPSDHPIYPERLVAILDRFEDRSGDKLQRKGFWMAGAVLVFQRAGLAGKEKIFERISPFKNPREFILKARDAYPNA